MQLRIAGKPQLGGKPHHRGFADFHGLAQLAGGHEHRLVVMLDNVLRNLPMALREPLARLIQPVDHILHILHGERVSKEGVEGVVVYSVTGKPISARSENQQRLVRLYQENDMIFATGPAGTGKTYMSIALAVRSLKNKEIRKIILSRPAVEAGEKLGFLPGDMRDKIDPYLQPLYDALEDMIPAQKLREMMEQNVVQIAPLAFMRGRTLSDAVVILDEAQNTTSAQIKMFMTRMGTNTKMIITGDTSQVDLPRGVRSGLSEALEILDGVEGIGIIHMNKKDIVRHRLVTRIVEAYDKRKSENGNLKTVNEIQES